jgi:hypothetical protein
MRQMAFHCLRRTASRQFGWIVATGRNTSLDARTSLLVRELRRLNQNVIKEHMVHSPHGGPATS